MHQSPGTGFARAAHPVTAARGAQQQGHTWRDQVVARIAAGIFQSRAGPAPRRSIAAGRSWPKGPKSSEARSGRASTPVKASRNLTDGVLASPIGT
ncbi:hypothetical protein SAMN05444004_11226 [Jannaschia faecimaris]|uniref:Uncharacterized protein n=1 Tax=Jannaschia faecimaris TaxID=1244108 RepID=A0A1H3SID6_9RHOB|nr:hypothetical protein SAMN05444004_11226 [Jannaschia faecimaris]